MAGRPSNPVPRSIAKLQEAWALGFSKKEIVKALGITGMWYDLCADEVKGLSDDDLRSLQKLIDTGEPSQPTLALTYDEPVNVPGSDFDLVVYKKKSEEVWMIRMERKSPGPASTSGLPVTATDATTSVEE
jgi:hypothetical protein